MHRCSNWRLNPAELRLCCLWYGFYHPSAIVESFLHQCALDFPVHAFATEDEWELAFRILLMRTATGFFFLCAFFSCHRKRPWASFSSYISCSPLTGMEYQGDYPLQKSLTFEPLKLSVESFHRVEFPASLVECATYLFGVRGSCVFGKTYPFTDGQSLRISLSPGESRWDSTSWRSSCSLGIRAYRTGQRVIIFLPLENFARGKCPISLH